MASIHVIGLGPAGPDLVSTGSAQLIQTVPIQFLRTRRHPAASIMASAASFDHHYESLETFDDVYAAIVGDLFAAAGQDQTVLYAVPGSPVVAEQTVQMLLAQSRSQEVEVNVHPAMSFLDLTWVRLGIDPVALGVKIVDGHRFLETLPSDGGPALIAQCESRQTLSDIKLALEADTNMQVTMLQRLGLSEEVITTLNWADIDRGPEPDHLTSLYVEDLRGELLD